MRSLLAGILASLLFFALAGAASANDGATNNETGNLPDPDLAALRQAIDDFRTQLATLADACALAKTSTEATAAKDCASQYAALRTEFKQVKQAALVLARNQREWAKRAKQAADELKKEADKVDAAKQEEDGLRAKGLQDKIKWIDDRLLQENADMEAAQQHAQDARDAAAGLTGEKQDEANAMAAKWDEKAAQYAADIKRLTALRQQLMAALNAPKGCTSNVGSTCGEKKACASNSGTSCTTLHDKLAAQLKSLDEKIAYKKQKLAELKNLLAYKLSQADVTSGDEREHWLDLAKEVQDEIDQWTGYLTELLKQRAELVQRLNATPATAVRDELQRQLASLDELAAYKRQKIADAIAANDQDAVAEWTAKLNDVLAQRAEVLAKLNALPK